MGEQPIDMITLAKYAVGALLIMAGVGLVYIGKTTEGLAVIAIGLGLLGYSIGERQGLKKGLALSKASA